MSDLLLGLIVDINVHFYRCVAEAAIKYSRSFANVRFRIIERSLSDMLEHEDRPRLAGMICQPMAESDYECLRRENVAVVNFSTRRPLGELPGWVSHVVTDDYSIGAMAAAHFKGTGLRNFAFFGGNDLHYCHARAAGFIENLPSQSAVFVCDGGVAALDSWMISLPTPIGVFTGNDNYARQVIITALKSGLSVPQDVAVIGVDGDNIRSVLSPRLITSVLPDTDGIAKAAIDHLVRQINGPDPHNAASTTKRIAPLGLKYAESAPRNHSSDPNVAKALGWMEMHLAEAIDINAIAKVAGLSRRSLEYYFKKHLACSPYQKLLAMRLQRAQELLLSTQKTINMIALETGFSNQREFCVRFKQKTGVTPSAFQRAQQIRD